MDTSRSQSYNEKPTISIVDGDGDGGDVCSTELLVDISVDDGVSGGDGGEEFTGIGGGGDGDEFPNELSNGDGELSDGGDELSGGGDDVR